MDRNYISGLCLTAGITLMAYSANLLYKIHEIYENRAQQIRNEMLMESNKEIIDKNCMQF
jgi:hypothetical protein